MLQTVEAKDSHAADVAKHTYDTTVASITEKCKAIDVKKHAIMTQNFVSHTGQVTTSACRKRAITNNIQCTTRATTKQSTIQRNATQRHDVDMWFMW